jgi:hypothetical protein
MLFQQEEDEDVFEVEKLPFNEETRQSQWLLYYYFITIKHVQTLKEAILSL